MNRLTTRRLIYGLVIALATSILLNITAVVVSVSIATAKAQEADRKWCKFINFMSQLTEQPTNDRELTEQEKKTQKTFSFIVNGLRTDFDCEKVT